MTGTFTFRPVQPGVTAYTYVVNEGEARTVPAGPDGTATITWTPAEANVGRQQISVREHIGDVTSNPTDYVFSVAEPQ